MRLHDYLEYYASVQPDVALIEFLHPDGGREVMTYHDANARANQLARAFLDQGLSRGDRIAYLSKNSSDMMMMYYAAAKTGIIPVPLNYRLAPREWVYIINDAQCKMLMAGSEYVNDVQGISNELKSTSDFVVVDGGNSPAPWIEYDQWLAPHEQTNLHLPIDENDQLYQMYTSGTTGLPKGAMISHKSIDNNLGMLTRVLNLSQGRDRLLTVMPLYHAGGAVIGMAGISVGATQVMLRDFDPVMTVNCLEAENITMGLLVPAMIQACIVANPDLSERNFSNLKTMVYGASPIAEETLRTAIDAFGCDFVQVFGMTETSALATALSPDDHRLALDGRPELLLSAGRAALGTEVRIVDENGDELPRGTVGEITVRGPQIMMGYWHMDDATKSAIRNGWMFTGDAAMMDEQGYVFIQDRIKDMIVSGAENIYPREIENALFEHPNVADAAAIGIPSEKWGETILAFIVTKDGTDISAEEMIEFCRERLAGFKVPRQYEFIAELPRNATGKILKKDLREPYWQGIERRVG